MNKKLNLILVLLFATILIFGLQVVGVNRALAQNSVVDDGQRDSDYDGLTDKSEKEVYHTDYLNPDTDKDGYLDAAEVIVGANPIDPTSPISQISASGDSDGEVVVKMNTTPWFISRAAAIISFVLMFLVVLIGTGMTTSYSYRIFNPVMSWLTHKYLSIALGVTLLVHIFSLIFDKFINFGLLDVLVPFHSNFQPVYLSLGMAGFYILLIIMATSIFLRIKTPKFWRATHYLVYPMFTFSLLHGLFIGTDSKLLFMKLLYGSTGLIFVMLVVYRFVLYRRNFK